MPKRSAQAIEQRQPMADPELRGADILAVHWQDAIDALTDIRTQVFIEEQKVPVQDEWDSLDAISWHYLAQETSSVPVGCLRLTPDGQVTRLAVLKPYRGRGIAKDLMERVIKDAAERQFSGLFLHAQLPVIGFYEALGFSVSGPVFSDAGILHRPMTMALNAQPVARSTPAVSTLIRDPNLIVEEISAEEFQHAREGFVGKSNNSIDETALSSHIEYFSASVDQKILGLAALEDSQSIKAFFSSQMHHPAVVLALIDALKSKAARYRSPSLSIPRGLLGDKELLGLGFAPEANDYRALLPQQDNRPEPAFAENITISQAVLGTTKNRYPFRTFNQCRELVDLLTMQALRRIRIWSPQLDQDLFSRLDLANCCSKLARKNAHTRIEILIHDSHTLVHHGHHLLELSRRLPSSIKIKRADEETRQSRQELVLADDRGLMVRPTEEHYQGWANFNDIPACQRFHKQFERAWRAASEDPQLRVLNL